MSENEKGITREAKCPSCGTSLNRMPGRKIICKECNNPIFKRTHPLEGVPILVNEYGRITAEKMYNKIALDNEFLRIARGYCSEQMIEHERKILRKRFRLDPSARDIAWGVLNKAILKERDFHMLKGITSALALIAYRNEEPFFDLLVQASKYELLNYKQQLSESGLRTVKIVGCDCPVCIKDNGKVFSIDDALEKMPIPHKDCKYSINNQRPGWCSCRYVAHF